MTTCIVCDDLQRSWPDEGLMCDICQREQRVRDAVAEERARIVAMLRAEADGWERAYMNHEDEYADGRIAALRAMADRIEQGET